MVNQNKISRRKFLRLSASFSATLVLSACLPSINDRSSQIINSRGTYDDYNNWQRKIKAEPVARNFQQLRSTNLSVMEQNRMDELYALLIRQSYEYVIEEKNMNCAYQADEVLSICLSSGNGYNGGVGYLNLETGESFTSYEQYVTIMNWMAETENWDYLAPNFPVDRAMPVGGVNEFQRPLSFRESVNRRQIYKIRSAPITANPNHSEKLLYITASPSFDDADIVEATVRVTPQISKRETPDPSQVRLLSLSLKY